jgi:hypothetical protein
MTIDKKYLIWAPRILVMAFAALLLLFSMDAFEGSEPLARKTGGFLIHILPALITLGCLVVAWKYRMIGAALFLFLGIVFTFSFGTAKNWSLFLLISAPLFSASLLFFISAQKAK